MSWFPKALPKPKIPSFSNHQLKLDPESAVKQATMAKGLHHFTEARSTLSAAVVEDLASVAFFPSDPVGGTSSRILDVSPDTTGGASTTQLLRLAASPKSGFSETFKCEMFSATPDATLLTKMTEKVSAITAQTQKENGGQLRIWRKLGRGTTDRPEELAAPVTYTQRRCNSFADLDQYFEKGSMDTVIAMFCLPGRGSTKEEPLKDMSRPTIATSVLAKEVKLLKTMLKPRPVMKFGQDSSKGPLPTTGGKLLLGFWYETMDNWYLKQMLEPYAANCGDHIQQTVNKGKLDRDYHWSDRMTESIEGLIATAAVPTKYATPPWDGIHHMGGLCDLVDKEAEEKRLKRFLLEAGFKEQDLEFNWLHHRVGQSKTSGEFVVSPDPSPRYVRKLTGGSSKDKDNTSAAEEQEELQPEDERKTSWSLFQKGKKKKPVDPAEETWKKYTEDHNKEDVLEGVLLADLVGQWAERRSEIQMVGAADKEDGFIKAQHIYKNMAVQDIREEYSRLQEEKQKGSGAEHNRLFLEKTVSELRLPYWSTSVVVEAYLS